MSVLTRNFHQLMLEHHILMRAHAKAQARCSKQLLGQMQEIERLNTETMMLRAALVVRDTTLAWQREDQRIREAAIADLPDRISLLKQTHTLKTSIQELLQERLHWKPAAFDRVSIVRAPDLNSAQLPVDAEALEASLKAADLVICQTGCLSHGAYWRVQDHCKRTGKACVMVETPTALRIIRLHKSADENTTTLSVEAMPN